MHISGTLAALCTLMAVLLLLRIFWRRVPLRLQSTLFVCTVMAVGLILCSIASRCSFVSHRLNALLLWCGAAGYGFLLVRFSLLPPRWLSSIAAVILFLPIFSTSIVLPLSGLFHHSQGVSSVPMEDNLVSVRSIIDRSPVAPSAADLDIYYRPRWFPLIQRRKAGVRFFDTQCEASASYAVLQPNHRSVLLACPASPSDPPGTEASGAVIPLR